MTDYYDVVLALIPLTLAGISGLLVLSGVALTTSVTIAAVVPVGLVGHAMFVRAPVDATPASGPQSADAPGGNTEFSSAD